MHKSVNQFGSVWVKQEPVSVNTESEPVWPKPVSVWNRFPTGLSRNRFAGLEPVRFRLTGKTGLASFTFFFLLYSKIINLQLLFNTNDKEMNLKLNFTSLFFSKTYVIIYKVVDIAIYRKPHQIWNVKRINLPWSKLHLDTTSAYRSEHEPYVKETEPPPKPPKTSCKIWNSKTGRFGLEPVRKTGSKNRYPNRSKPKNLEPVPNRRFGLEPEPVRSKPGLTGSVCRVRTGFGSGTGFFDHLYSLVPWIMLAE